MKFLIILLFTSQCFAQGLKSDPVDPAIQLKHLEAEELKEKLSITKYEPIYFAYGNPSTKVQFSFKYQLINWLEVYFGYTQLMLWNLNLDSDPFKDVNYGPEIFYHYIVKTKLLESIDFSPFAHLSNGRDGVASRSINRGYVRFNLHTPVSEGEVRLAATVFSYYGLSSDNSDIWEYVGPLDLKFTVTQFIPWVFDKGEFYLRVFPGGSYAERWDRGGQELGLSFRLGGIGLKPSLYLQYYNGYAESLIGYKNQERQFRIGILL